ncbi:hypothetical protein RBU49_06555 [Clostridium sp. MB40-C1]|uniref:hypothetical protein n=1 Tax=Clostridium sp. MB40-C1 TaxID=3070996 RepID=UPI0027DFB108|nr:hypothetical protein [Clostridium sp. MB40-C1]WMJ81903.1 hypothetical protein RBU49_06555 [Clostridium sp. MB40-C1]
MFQSINRDHIKGALIGVGICAVGYYVYKKNQTQVESFLKDQGINVSNNVSKNYNSMSLEELMETKELIEDIIAEKEMNEPKSFEVEEAEITAE